MSDHTPDASGFAQPAHPAQPAYPAQPAQPAYPASPAQTTPGSGFAPPQGYPQVPPPGQEYAQPYAAPYVMPSAPQYGQVIGAPLPVPPGAGGLGLSALIIALVAMVVPTVLAAVAGFGIGEVLARNGAGQVNNPGFMPDLSLLAGARESVMLGEIAFWAGTILGIWAIVQGIIAIVKRRGRGTGIAAIVIAALAPMAFLFAAYVMVIIGLATTIAPLTS